MMKETFFFTQLFVARWFRFASDVPEKDLDCTFNDDDSCGI
jgi:hypothetical protein